jgi:hypothetical protein
LSRSEDVITNIAATKLAYFTLWCSLLNGTHSNYGNLILFNFKLKLDAYGSSLENSGRKLFVYPLLKKKEEENFPTKIHTACFPTQQTSIPINVVLLLSN